MNAETNVPCRDKNAATHVLWFNSNQLTLASSRLAEWLMGIPPNYAVCLPSSRREDVLNYKSLHKSTRIANCTRMRACGRQCMMVLCQALPKSLILNMQPFSTTWK